MHPTITATELDLLTFFESEPDRLDPNDPWHLNDSVYCYSDGKLQISFALAPTYKDVRIVLSEGGRKVYELQAMGVRDVAYLSEGRGRNESIVVTLHAFDTLTIRLKPNIEIAHAYSSGDR